MTHQREPDDASLVRLAQRGDRQALGRLLRRHEPRLYRVAFGLLGHHDDAREATQDAFVSAVRRVDQFRGDAAVGTWLTRIVINAAKDVLRRRRRRPAVPFSALSKPGTPEQPWPQTREPSPAHGVEHHEELERLNRALSTLATPLREVLVLRDLNDLGYAQIGEALELPVGTVKSRLFRARLALREALRPASDPASPLTHPLEPATKA